MSKHSKLSKLIQQKARDYWGNEAADFTPWLKKNIKLLGDAIGIDDLEAEETESSVGSFSLDILCRYGNDNVLIVENQLEKTDHNHLGQLLTYAAGKDAATVVWVSTEFHDRHRAALDWLNRHTDEGIHFFGVQIEVWQIGSESAPKFNVICKPNKWAETTKVSGEMSEIEKKRLDFWTGLQEYMENSKGNVPVVSPTRFHWMGFSIGRGGFHMNSLVGFQHDWIGVRLIITRSVASAHYNLLYKDKDEIEDEYGSELNWRELPDKKQSQIDLRWDKCNLANTKDWGKLHEWLYENLERFNTVFGYRIRELKARDWLPPQKDEPDESDDPAE